MLKLHGDINDIRTMQLNPEVFWKGLSDEKWGMALKEVYGCALKKGHMVYLGTGLTDATIAHLHQAWRDKNEKSEYLRVALFPSWEFDHIKPRVFNDIEFLTYDRDTLPAQAVREFLSRIVDVRRSNKDKDWRPCEEATDIRNQMFLSAPGEPLEQRHATEAWSCNPKSLSSQ